MLHFFLSLCNSIVHIPKSSLICFPFSFFPIFPVFCLVLAGNYWKWDCVQPHPSKPYAQLKVMFLLKKQKQKNRLYTPVKSCRHLCSQQLNEDFRYKDLLIFKTYFEVMRIPIHSFSISALFCFVLQKKRTNTDKRGCPDQFFVSHADLVYGTCRQNTSFIMRFLLIPSPMKIELQL